MAEIHVATHHPFTEALVQVVVQWIRDYKPGKYPYDEELIYDLWTEALDHLQIPLATVVAEWELAGNLVFNPYP